MNCLDKYFAFGINPTDTTKRRSVKIAVMGKKIFNIFSGFKPKDVITVSSYSLDSLDKVIAKDIKNVIGKVKKII